MSAGVLRFLVRVLTPQTEDDGQGGQRVTGWTPGQDRWADIQALTAREQAIAGAVQTISTHRVRMHYDAAIVSTSRLRRVAPAGTDLQILGVRPDDHQRWLELDCAETVGGVEA